LTQILVGTGGWAYFNVPGDPLRVYSEIFDMVEVNSTFYEFPNLSIVRSWRERVPERFEFAVLCHQDLTHRHKFSPVESAFKDWNYMMDVCRCLSSEILIVHIPPSLEISSSKIEDLNNFFSSVDPAGIHLAWNIVSQREEDRNRLIDFIRDRGFTHCVDLSVEDPAFESEITYSQLFGKSEYAAHQFSDEELTEINKKAESTGSEKVYLSYHGIKMYKDADRLRIYRKSGRFPPVTRSRGVDSAIEVLREDIKLPATKKSLIQDQGWKIFDLTDEKRVRLQEILQDLPDKVYGNFRELTTELKELETSTPSSQKAGRES